MKRSAVVSVLLALSYVIFNTTPARAHHAFGAMFDASKPVKIRGTFSKIELINPHAFIHIEVKRADGTVEVWMVEAANAATLQRRGYTRELLTIGMEVVVDGYHSKNGSAVLHGRDLTLPNGQT